MFKHPKDNGMTYLQHLVFAVTNGFRLMFGGCCCVIHGFIPCWFETVASNIVESIYRKIKRTDEVKIVKKEQYSGIVDSLLDNILERYGISQELVKQVTDIVDGVTKNVEVKEIGDETYVTINLNKIHFKFKK